MKIKQRRGNVHYINLMTNTSCPVVVVGNGFQPEVKKRDVNAQQ